MTAENVPSPRIGNEERNSAMGALDTHLEAGRLDAEEYGERAGRISVARTVADLEPLFTDLPQPHPVIGSPPRPSDPGSPARLSGRDRNPGRHDDREPLGGRVGATVVAVSPIIAVILFFALNSVFSAAWLVFLLIPAAGAIVYGGKWRGE